MISNWTLQLKLLFKKDPVFFFLLALGMFLPFQFALNPAKGFDVAIVRAIIPIFFLVWIFLKLKNKEKILEKNTLTILLFAFLLLAVFSISFSANLLWSFRKLLFLLTIFPIYLISLSVLKNTNRKRLVLTSLVSGATVLAWIAIAQFLSQFIFSIDAVYTFIASNISPFFLGKSFANSVLTYPSWLVATGGTTYMRAVAMFPDPHMLSYYFEILIPWSVAFWAMAKKRTLWLYISMISLIVADVLTFTRGSYIALIAGAIIILPLVSRKTALKISLGAFLLFFLFNIVPNNPVAGRLVSSFDVQEGSNQARLGNWQQAVLIISKHPFGVGIGAYSLAVDSSADYREPIYAHNLYLDITAELGVFALLIFVTILLFTFKSFWVMTKVDSFWIAGVSSITIFSIHSVVENPMYSVHILPLILIILAISASNYHYEKNNNA